MGVVGIDHVNIRTPDPGRAIAFYRDVLGMTASATPGMAEGRSGWMLDRAGHAAVHIGHAALPYPSDDAVPWTADAGGGAVHHVALACEDRASMEARLAEHGVAWTVNRVDAVSLTQLFVVDPDGVLLELNFREP